MRWCELRNSKNNSHLGRLREKDLEKKDKPVDNSDIYGTKDPTGTSKCANRDFGNNFGTHHDEENIKRDQFEENAQSADGAGRVSCKASKQFLATQQHKPGARDKTKPPKSKKVREVFIKMTVRGTMVRSEVCNSWCFCLESQI